jgi:alpha-glucosidase
MIVTSEPHAALLSMAACDRKIRDLMSTFSYKPNAPAVCRCRDFMGILRGKPWIGSDRLRSVPSTQNHRPTPPALINPSRSQESRLRRNRSEVGIHAPISLRVRGTQLLVITFLVFSSAQAQTPGSVLSFSRSPKLREYTLTTANKVQVKISFYRPDVFRILAAPSGIFADPKNDPKKAQIVIDSTICAEPIQVHETPTLIDFTTSKLMLQVEKKNCTFKLWGEHHKLIWAETKPISFGPKTTQTLSTKPDEYFFGGGQQNGNFSHKGKNIEIVADGNWDDGGHPNPAPFYMANTGYGVLRNTFATGHYDFTSNQAIDLTHNENRFDAYYFVGNSMNRVLDLYTQFTGRPNFVPIWALELGDADAWMARDPKTKELLKDKDGKFVKITPDCIPRNAEQYRKNDMPGGWFLVNDGYGCGYVDLPQTVKGLAALGFHTGLWTEQGLAKTKWEVGTAGTRLQKLDVAWTGPAYQHSLDANKQAWDSLVTNSDTRGFVWTVQGWAGTQRYSICWTGDQTGTWDFIRYHIPTVIGSGLSGQAYATTDVDGIFGGSPETYVRDLQWKCFTPVLYAMNGWSQIRKSPWTYQEPYRSISRKYLKLKMQMTPYMYKYAKEALNTGAPIVRAMNWEFPKDKTTWGRAVKYQYMLGESLLVAPVFTSMNLNKGWRREPIYLPRGQWVDYSDGRVIEGPTTIQTYPITLEKLPLFVRGGAIIPLYPEMLYNNQKPKDPLTFDIYPHGNSKFEMYEDDGETRKYQKGESARQVISVKAPNGGDIRVKIGPSIGEFKGKLTSRVYQLQIHSDRSPVSIKLDGKQLRTGWTFNKNEKRGVIHVKLPRISTSKNVNLIIHLEKSTKIPPARPYSLPPKTKELNKAAFVVTASSGHGGTGIANAFDGTPETIWHSDTIKDKPATFPFTVDVDLGGLFPINGFQYLPRQTGENGMIANYEIYVTKDKAQFGPPVFKGTFLKSKEKQTANFPTTWGKYLRLKILSEVNGKNFASAAEFDVMQDLEPTKTRKSESASGS